MKVRPLQIAKLQIVDSGGVSSEDGVEDVHAKANLKVGLPWTQTRQKGSEGIARRGVIKRGNKKGNKEGNKGSEGTIDPHPILEHCELESEPPPTIVCRYQGRPRRINLAVCEWHCEERDQECVRLQCPRVNRVESNNVSSKS